jgi:hypothetical protein
MALTTLDPNVALLLVDPQEALVGNPFIHPLAEMAERVWAPIDARPEAHNSSPRNVLARLGETGAAQEIIDLFAKRSA